MLAIMLFVFLLVFFIGLPIALFVGLWRRSTIALRQAEAREAQQREIDASE